MSNSLTHGLTEKNNSWPGRYNECVATGSIGWCTQETTLEIPSRTQLDEQYIFTIHIPFACRCASNSQRHAAKSRKADRLAEVVEGVENNVKKWNHAMSDWGSQTEQPMVCATLLLCDPVHSAPHPGCSTDSQHFELRRARSTNPRKYQGCPLRSERSMVSKSRNVM